MGQRGRIVIMTDFSGERYNVKIIVRLSAIGFGPRECLWETVQSMRAETTTQYIISVMVMYAINNKIRITYYNYRLNHNALENYHRFSNF